MATKKKKASKKQTTTKKAKPKGRANARKIEKPKKRAPTPPAITSDLLSHDPIASEILRRVREALSPSQLNIKNLSQAHAKHKESKQHGGGHYSLYVVSESFDGLALKERHTWIFGLIGDLLESKKIHAIQLDLKNSSEVPLREKLSENTRPVVKLSSARRRSSP